MQPRRSGRKTACRRMTSNDIGGLVGHPEGQFCLSFSPAWDNDGQPCNTRHFEWARQLPSDRVTAGLSAGHSAMSRAADVIGPESRSDLHRKSPTTLHRLDRWFPDRTHARRVPSVRTPHCRFPRRHDVRPFGEDVKHICVMAVRHSCFVRGESRQEDIWTTVYTRRVGQELNFSGR